MNQKKLHLAFIGLVLIGASILRLVNLGHAPPGLNQDEAANAWNAYCLLQTGKDQTGNLWPIFYSPCLGSNRSTLFLYLLMPFQAIGGLSVLTTRLPCALGGVLTVGLVYWLGVRLFDRWTGLASAAFLTLNPWHIQQSRWGHEGAIVPLLVVGSLALLVWAGLPPFNREGEKHRLFRALMAGVVAGVSCYGYPSVRLFLPAFLALWMLVNVRTLWAYVKSRRGLLAVVLYVGGFAALFAPLAWEHLSAPEAINKRAASIWVWDEGDSTGTKLGHIVWRYLHHFGPDFLFIHGDPFLIQSPPGMGQFHWYLMPLLIVGLLVCLQKTVSNASLRFLLLWLVLYPLGDCLFRSYADSGAHAIRSLPGVCAFVMIAAIGLTKSLQWMDPINLKLAGVSRCAFVLWVAYANVNYLNRFFGEYDRLPYIYEKYHTDLLTACDWLRPRLSDIDHVFVTTQRMNQPYIVMMVGLAYDPKAWFSEPMEVDRNRHWHCYQRIGKLSFMYDNDRMTVARQLNGNDRKDRVVFIVRPGEKELSDPAFVITDSSGKPTLWIVQVAM